MNLISHPAEGNHPEKPLRTHLENVAIACKNQILSMRLNLNEYITKEELAKLSYHIGMFHDLGKASTYFQRKIRGQGSDKHANHALISALSAFLALEKLKEPFRVIAFIVIWRHHGALETFEESKLSDWRILTEIASDILQNSMDELNTYYDMDMEPILQRLADKDELEEIAWKISEIIDDQIEDRIENEEKEPVYYFIASLLFSLLIDNDKMDAARIGDGFFKGSTERIAFDVFPYIESLRKKNPEKFNSDTDINRLRNTFLKQIDQHSDIKEENHFYKISAPTGIGKTFGSLIFAHRLKSLLPKGEGRVIYCLPYTSIIDQNYDEFEKIIRFNMKEEYDNYSSKYLIKHHHLADKKLGGRSTEEDYHYKSYQEDVLLTESWQSAVIVTTFVQIFHSIFGVKNRLLKKFHHMINSIVILDEVQNIDPKFYRLLRNGLSILGKYFNIYFLLITATQPKIFLPDDSAVEIIGSDDFMKEKPFNRVKMTIDKESRSLDEFTDEFLSDFYGKNALVIMNTKKSALKFYQRISDEMSEEYTVRMLTTLHIPKHRKEIIEVIKKDLENGVKTIVVSTQLVEAGVDFSFQKVYRDLAPLDSIIQSAGRCNRNGEWGELGGEMRLLRLTDDRGKEFSSYIYSDKLSQETREVLMLKAENHYQSSDFSDLTEYYYSRLDFKADSEIYLKAIYELNYKTLSELKLIKNDYANYSLYVLHDENAQDTMGRYVELISKYHSDEILDSEKLEFERIKSCLKYYELQVGKKTIDELEGFLEEELSEYRFYVSYEYANEIYNIKTGLKMEIEDMDSFN